MPIVPSVGDPLFTKPQSTVRTGMKNETIACVASLLSKTPVNAQDPVVCHIGVTSATLGREKVLFIWEIQAMEPQSR